MMVNLAVLQFQVLSSQTTERSHLFEYCMPSGFDLQRAIDMMTMQDEAIFANVFFSVVIPASWLFAILHRHSWWTEDEYSWWMIQHVMAAHEIETKCVQKFKGAICRNQPAVGLTPKTNRGGSISTEKLLNAANCSCVSSVGCAAIGPDWERWRLHRWHRTFGAGWDRASWLAC